MILASQEMIRYWTGKGAWGEKTFIDYFKENAAQNPDRECLIDPLNKEALLGLAPERLTYRKLDRAIDATAEGLVARGIQKDDIIIVQLPNCWELAMLYLAIARAGGLISPVPVQWRRKELDHILRKTEAKAFITVEEFNAFSHTDMGRQLQSGAPTLKQIITLDEIREMSQGRVTGRLDDIPIDPNDIFTLCWSSGTEADPKGCPLSHNNWLYQVALCYQTAPISKGDNLITAGPLVNMASIGTVFVEWLRYGGKFVLHHPFDGPTFIMQLISEEINYTLLVPAVVNGLLKHPLVDKFDLSKVNAITIGAAPPSLWSVQELKRRWGIEFGNIWGMNEGPANLSGPSNMPDMEMRVDHFPHLGKPGSTWGKDSTSFLELKVVDSASGGELTREGEVGELLYRGPNVIPGYFRSPELNARAFDKDGFFHTGDLFQIKDKDCIGFFDRTKDIIIRGGFNISAQEVENVLLGHPGIRDVAVVAMEDAILGEKVCAYVVPGDGQQLTLGDVTSFMENQGMAVYKFPERLEIIDAIPRNPVGKVLKHVLREDIRQKMQAA
ncbi:MAG: acyl--CoA ligase [Deltaproteobacteria bacterium]|nr:acyl--CoA ligase [Deltaproteobacteria bacterium]